MSPDDFRRLAAAGLTTDQIALVMDIMAASEAAHSEADEKRKADQRARWRKWKHGNTETNVSQREQTLANNSREQVTRVEDKTSNSEIEPHQENKKRERALASLAGFDEWYSGYPHKVQRGAAERAWPKARSLASQAELIAGRDRYIASKPADRAWQNPATWLNGKGWLDAPAASPLPRGSPPNRQNGVISLIDEMLARNGASHDGPTIDAEPNPPPARQLSGPWR